MGTVVSYKVEDREIKVFNEFVMKENALPIGQRLMFGISNKCEKKEGYYHVFFDIDKKSLSEIIQDLERLQEEFKKLGAWILTLSSPFSFQALNFAYVTWEEFMEIGKVSKVCEQGYLYRSNEKKYAVLRVGEKQGIIPTPMYLIRGKVGCVHCRNVYMKRVGVKA